MTHPSWGPGWPNCQSDKIIRDFYVDTKWGRVSFPGGVRREVAELMSRLVKETANRGYRFGVPGNASYGCWGFNCRAIGGTKIPSNHSWGLAIDINAPSNPQSWTLTTDMPSWMPDLWNAYGFRWGGDYVNSKKDPMHYEFIGSTADATMYLLLAQKNRLGENRVLPPKPPIPTPVEDDEMLAMVRGDVRNDVYLTNGVHKSAMNDQNEYNVTLLALRKIGFKVLTDANSQPLVLPQLVIDQMGRSDANVVNDTWTWWATTGDGPAHKVIKQATS